MVTRGGGGATQSHSLSTCHPDGAPVLLEEDAATVTKLLAVRLITKGLKIVFCLLDMKKYQAQELAVDAARGRYARRQKSHLPVAAICAAIATSIADLVGGALEDVVRVVGVAELALSLPIVTCTFLKLWRTVIPNSKSVFCATRMLRISRLARRLPSLVSTRL